MNKQLLEEIGLTKSEINVYLALLELGSSATGKIVETSKASSSKIYEVLNKLIEKGLVSFVIKSGVKYFEAASPERIMDYMQEREKSFNKQKEELKKIIPVLALKRTLAKHASEATVYKGLKGIETAFFKHTKEMNAEKEMLMHSFPTASEPLKRFFMKLDNELAKKHVKRRYLFNESIQRQSLQLASSAKIKYVNEQMPSIIIIFKEAVLILPETRDLLLIEINSKEVVESFKVQFETFWQQDVGVGKGIDEIHHAWDKMLNELKSGEEYYVLGASWRGQKKEVHDYFIDFHKRRKAKEVKAKFLFVAGAEEMVKKYRDVYSWLADVKFLPHGVYEGMQINLYHNKVLMFVWREKEPIVFTIEDKKVHTTFKTYFDALWRQAKSSLI